MTKRILLVAALIGAVPLAGCISFGAKPPPSLLTLDAAQALPAGQVQNSATTSTITIAVPAVPQMLATQRVPVQTGETQLAYIKDALWVEQPSRLFARLMTDTITARTGRVVLGQAQSYADPGARLTGDLRRFGVLADTSEAVVTFDAALVRDGAAGATAAVQKRRFEARVPLTTIDAPSAGAALNQAANQVAAQVADWVGR